MSSRGLREMRKFRNMTQKELGAKVGVSGDTISKIERGERRLNERLAESLSDIFDVEPLELKVMNALSIAEKRYDELDYKLGESEPYMDPGEFESYVASTWSSIRDLASDAAMAQTKGTYNKEVDEQLKQLYDVAYRMSELVANGSEKLLSIAGGVEPQVNEDG